VGKVPELYAPAFHFFTNPLVVMLMSLAVATYTLGLSRGMKIQPLMDDYGNSVKDIAVILLIIAGAGTLKEVFTATGVDKNISTLVSGLSVNPLVLGWLIAGVIRVSLGSATVAGMTAAALEEHEARRRGFQAVCGQNVFDRVVRQFVPHHHGPVRHRTRAQPSIDQLQRGSPDAVGVPAGDRDPRP
jgi:hypothetical protein